MFRFSSKVGDSFLLADKIQLRVVAVEGDEVAFELGLPAPPAPRPRPRTLSEWNQALDRGRLTETPENFNPG
jgi:hypothetical protein